MPDNLTAVEDWTAAFLARLEPGERRVLTGQLARELRKSQQARIAAQQDPDGTRFAPRKPQKNLRGKIGALKRGPMFQKLRLAKRLKIIEASANEIGIGFTGRDARIARAHQDGASERLGKVQVTYARRRLLGFTDADSSRLMDQVLAFIDTR